MTGPVGAHSAGPLVGATPSGISPDYLLGCHSSNSLTAVSETFDSRAAPLPVGDLEGVQLASLDLARVGLAITPSCSAA